MARKRRSSIKKRIRVPQVQEPAPKRWSQCLRAGDLVFISGMVSYDHRHRLVGRGDALAQCRHTFKNLRAFVEAAGGTMDDIVRTTVWLTDIRYRPALLQARAEAFRGVEDLPTVTLVGGVDLAHEELMVEIDAIACIPQKP
ncbi:MAG TPA: RidA family protein [Stellaceae bacterium]|nr:RidA family protein [Stellaceae bacterium]